MALTAASSTATEFPTEGQLMLHLLGFKVHGKPIPNYGITFHECDLYGDKNPWEIWQDFGGGDIINIDGSRELYFFSTLKIDTPSSLRTIGLGSWEPHGKDKTILDDVSGTCHQRVGVRKCFRFDKSGTNHDAAWILHEYSLDPSYHLTTPSANYNYVLCKLFKNQENPIRLTSREGITSQEEVTNNSAAAPITMVDLRSINAQVEGGGDKRIEVEETSAEERPIKGKKGKPQQMVGDNKITVEEAIDDDNLSWPQLFSTQLIESKKGAVKQQEEGIELVPNPLFAKDLLLERLD